MCTESMRKGLTVPPSYSVADYQHGTKDASLFNRAVGV